MHPNIVDLVNYICMEWLWGLIREHSELLTKATILMHAVELRIGYRLLL